MPTMKADPARKTLILGFVIVSVSIVVGSVIISRAPHFEKTEGLEWIESRSGTTYIMVGDRGGEPIYKRVPGPGASGVQIEPKYLK